MSRDLAWRVPPRLEGPRFDIVDVSEMVRLCADDVGGSKDLGSVLRDGYIDLRVS